MLSKVYIMKHLNLLLVFTLLLSLSTGCADVIDFSGSSDEGENPAGIWIGTQTVINDGVYDMNAIVYDGKIYGVSESANVLFSGTYDMQGGRYLVSDGSDNATTRYDLYTLSSNGAFFTSGIVTTEVNQKSTMTGAFSNEMLQEGEISFHYSKLYEKESSISYLAGSQSNSVLAIDVADDGRFSGSLNSCSINGTIATPEPTVNIYEVSYTLSNCAEAGSYEGLGIITDIDGSAYFMALAHGANRMDMFGFPANTTLPDVRTIFTTKRKDYGSVDGDNNDGGDFSGEYLAFDGIKNASFKNSDFSGSTLTLSCCSADGLKEERVVNTDFSGSDFSNFELRSVSADDAASYGVEIDFWTFINPPRAMSNATFDDSNFRSSKLDFDAEDSSFKNSDFTLAHLNGRIDNLDFTGGLFKYATIGFFVEDSTFKKADFRDCSFSPDPNNTYTLDIEIAVNTSNFEGANFEGVDFEKINFRVSNLKYANMKDVKNIRGSSWQFYLSYLGNAWWNDGSRCAASSIGICIPKALDNGLTYEEYLKGKSDLEKDLEILELAAKDTASKAKSFVKDTWKSLW
jgi:uncharacterized protein YjbI with pentapeptide repeats